MAKNPKPAPDETPPPVPGSGGSYELVDGALRKRAPETTDTLKPAEPPANQE